ncbi:DoxX family protein [Echinicola sp. 20G]|uniref:DoxX family protein n=1 Tax=Echinicola sp. 20G TaxID=2781961 RepID=UPI0019106A39|nr:DoxX family protein [Echinicola sp. 20G]
MIINNRTIKFFLRLALSSAFLSAVADRFGMWSDEVSVWGNWQNFINYTQLISPWIPNSLISIIGTVVTALEIIFAFCLLVGFKTEFFAKLSAVLLLIFALSMTFSTGIKGAFDFSVFTASAAAFALGSIKEKYMEVDKLMINE